MTNTNKKTTGIIDLAAFDKLESEDFTKLENLIVKVRDSKMIMNLPEWIVNYTVAPGTRPCPWPVPKCMAQILKIQREKAINIHPIHQLDMVVSTNDVVLNPKGVTYVEEKKQVSMGVSVGYLVPNINDCVRLMNANSSEIAATDAKYDKKGNLNPPEWPENFKVPVAECNNVRVALENITPSRSIARDQMFSRLSDPGNMVQSIRMHAVIGKKMANYTEVPKLTTTLRQYYVANKMKIPEDLKGLVVGVDNGDLPCTDNPVVAYKYYFKSTSIRGGRDGGGLAHGFERFCMSRTMANTLNLLQDFLNMSEEYDSKTVLVRDSSYLTTEQIRVLVHNGFRLLMPNQTYGKCVIDSPAGIYASYDNHIPKFEFVRISEENVRPSYANGQITLGTLYEEAIEKISKRKRCFSYVYLDNRLKAHENSTQLLPSATADNLQVICATGATRTYPFDALVRRATMAISCRNRFLHCRKPFHTMDIMNDFVRWNRSLHYPRLRALEEAKFLDLEAFTQGDLSLKVVPLKVHEEHFDNMVAQAEAITLTPERLVEEMLGKDAQYLCEAFIGNLNGDRFQHVGDAGRNWRSRYDPIFQMSEHDFLVIVTRNGSRDIYDNVMLRHYPPPEDDEDQVEENEVPAEPPAAIPFDLSAFSSIDINDRS